MKGNTEIHLPNQAYRDNYDAIFRKKPAASTTQIEMMVSIKYPMPIPSFVKETCERLMDWNGQYAWAGTKYSEVPIVLPEGEVLHTEEVNG